MKFDLKAPYQPTGDQPKAIEQLLANLQAGQRAQTLLGVTGSGKTFTMANVIQQANRPTLIISHNKTLAAQLYSEFKEYFPDNLVEYFVSYYDYYQPEAYIPSTNVYIEKDLSINEEIDKMRLSAVSALLSGRKDVIVISSVSCIYGMGNPNEFSKNVASFSVGDTIAQEDFLLELVNLLYSRNEVHFERGTFRVRGDTVDVHLAYASVAYRFFFFGDEIEMIHEISPTTGERLNTYTKVKLFPAALFVTNKETLKKAVVEIEKELDAQVAFFLRQGKEEEATRLEERTRLDIDMMKELGYCSGIENYSRCFDGRAVGERPYCLIDYFPKDFLMFVDESHVSLPQVRGMWGGDHARKKHLVEYGFRIPAAMDNRPLSFDEFYSLIHQVIYVSATPANYELEDSEGVIVEQIIRPTGLLDPPIEIVPTKNQIDHLLHAIQERIRRQERALVVTITKKMAEELTKYLLRAGIRCEYIHSEVKTLDRVSILEDLRKGVIDVLVGVNLLREGLDLPEVSLVAILDADKQGFLRNTRSLIQMIGRAARHMRSKVIMYADKVTQAMDEAIGETNRRREKQMAHNKAHGLVPKAVKKAEQSLVSSKKSSEYRNTDTTAEELLVAAPEGTYYSATTLQQRIRLLKKKIEVASSAMDYIKADKLQTELLALKKHQQS